MPRLSCSRGRSRQSPPAARIPAIETAPDGSLLAFAEARKYTLDDPGFGKQDIDLVLRRSTDQGQTWSPMRVIEDPGELWSAANPTTVVDRQTGQVWVFYLRCKPARNTDTARPGPEGDRRQPAPPLLDRRPAGRRGGPMATTPLLARRRGVNSRLRIGLLAPPWVPVPPPSYGGIEQVVATLATGLVERGHEVVLVAAPGSSLPGVEVVSPLAAIPGIIGLAFAQSAWLLFLSAFEVGFFLVSTSPVGMQYAAEITFPTPEGTSNGLVQLFGQASVVFVYIMQAIQTEDGSFTPALLFSVGLLVVSALLTTQMKDAIRK